MVLCNLLFDIKAYHKNRLPNYEWWIKFWFEEFNKVECLKNCQAQIYATKHVKHFAQENGLMTTKSVKNNTKRSFINKKTWDHFSVVHTFYLCDHIILGHSFINLLKWTLENLDFS